MAKKDYSSSNRRKFLIGAGSVAAGGSALFGTAATTTFNLNNRSVGANVVADSDGALKLTDGEPQGDIINEVDGKLEIDFAAGDGGGVNVGSVVEVGNWPAARFDPAFSITNQTTAPVDLDVEFEPGTGFEAIDSMLSFRLDDDGSFHNVTVARNTVPPIAADNPSASISALGDGETIDVGIRVNADRPNSSTDEDLSGVLNITATQNSL